MENGSETGGLMHLVNYGYSIFLPFVDFEYKEIYTGFLSLFPLPLIWAMIYVYNKENHIEFLMPMILAIVLESIFCMTKLDIFKYIGLLGYWKMNFVAAAIGLSCIYLYMYMLTNIEDNIFNMISAMRITLICLVFYFFIPRPIMFAGIGYMNMIAMFISLLYFLFMNFADKRYTKVLYVVLAISTIVSSVPVWIMSIVK